MESLSLFTLVCIVFIFASPFIFKKLLPSPSALANIATTLGILGTFVGIFLGLWNFDVNDIARSVPVLLEGLKTAFLTSIAGIITSIIVKVFPNFYRVDTSIPQPMDNRPEIMINLLKDIRNGISVNGENSLVNQISSLRRENKQNFEMINGSLNQFADKIVDNSIEKLIEALAHVMEDFNSKINDKLTNSIDQLNGSTKNLLDWQTEYAHQVEDMCNQFINALDGIDQARKILADISNKSQVYYESADKLNHLLRVLNINLAAIDNIAKSSKEILPTIESKMEQLTTNFSNAVIQSVRENNSMFEHQKQAINVQINTFEKSYREIGQLQQKQILELSGNLEGLLKRSTDSLNEHFVNLDKELTEQLNKVIDGIGDKLGSLTAHILNDYVKIAQQLRNMVETSNFRN